MASFQTRPQNLQGYTSFFQHWAPAILSSLGPDTPTDAPPADALQVALLRQSRHASTFHIRADDSHAMLKLFDGDRHDSLSHYHKERSCLAHFKGQDDVARHMAHCDDAGFVMTHVAKGAPCDIHTTANTVLTVARALGAWLARFDALAPSTNLTGSWGGYLAQYDSFGRLDQYPVLFDTPLLGRALAVCDTALSNFLIDGHGHITRVDFETATMKPRGWDFIFTYESLARRYPDQADTILDAISAGFFRHHKGALLPEELETLARTLFCERLNRLSANTAPQTPQSPQTPKAQSNGH